MRRNPEWIATDYYYYCDYHYHCHYYYCDYRHSNMSSKCPHNCSSMIAMTMMRVMMVMTRA